MKKVRRLLALLMAVSIAVVSAGCSKEITAEDLMVNIEENNASELDLDDAFCEKYSVAAFKMLKMNTRMIRQRLFCHLLQLITIRSC